MDKNVFSFKMASLGVILGIVFISLSAYAGTSVFKSKHKVSNDNGVNAIGVHICSNLECPPVRIVEGECTGEHMTKHWGVCVCDAGYVAKGNTCESCPDGQFSDGISGCMPCPDKTHRTGNINSKCL